MLPAVLLPIAVDPQSRFSSSNLERQTRSIFSSFSRRCPRLPKCSQQAAVAAQNRQGRVRRSIIISPDDVVTLRRNPVQSVKRLLRRLGGRQANLLATSQRHLPATNVAVSRPPAQSKKCRRSSANALVRWTRIGERDDLLLPFGPHRKPQLPDKAAWRGGALS
jgi:hypothetical protein